MALRAHRSAAVRGSLAAVVLASSLMLTACSQSQNNNPQANDNSQSQSVQSTTNANANKGDASATGAAAPEVGSAAQSPICPTVSNIVEEVTQPVGMALTNPSAAAKGLEDVATKYEGLAPKAGHPELEKRLRTVATEAHNTATKLQGVPAGDKAAEVIGQASTALQENAIDAASMCLGVPAVTK